jgi:hypothetical protein
MKAAITILFAALALSGCAPSGDENDNYGTKVITVEYRDRDLICIEREGGGYGAYSGLTCDFVKFYMEGRS